MSITSRSSTQLVVSATFGTTAATWWAKAVNGSLSSNQYNFQVNAPAAPPAITSVSPNPIIGSNSPQTFTINGTGFTSASTVTLGNPYNTYPNVSITSRSSTQLVVSATFGTTAATWWAKAIDSNRTSNQYSFAVQAPAVPGPAISSISPTPVPASTAVTVDIYGSNFRSGVALQFAFNSGATAAPVRMDATVIDAGHLRITINTGTVCETGVE
jgi:hypothetical protein